MTTELVPFRYFVMPCCDHNLCWVNPRLPNFCPECGQSVYAQLKIDPSTVRVFDPSATLEYSP